MRLNRPASERKLDPRETPLSHQLGKLCAGIAADASHTHASQSHNSNAAPKHNSNALHNHNSLYASHSHGSHSQGSHSHESNNYHGGNLLHEVSCDVDVNALSNRFPVADIGYSVYFNPGLL
jgi:hypothetical protein